MLLSCLRVRLDGDSEVSGIIGGGASRTRNLLITIAGFYRIRPVSL